MRWKPHVCIYHHPCNDGFAAAWAVWRRWGDAVRYIPANYGQPAPDVTGKNVLIVDFSFKRQVLEQMIDSANSIVILDHHKSAQQDLAPFVMSADWSGFHDDLVPGFLAALAEQPAPPCIAWFDMAASGARLAWEFCHEGQPLHPLIRFVEDRDLWRFQYSQSKPFHLYLSALPKDLRRWDNIATEMQTGALEEIMARAEAVGMFYDQRISEMVENARLVTIGGFNVPTVNAPGAFASDVGHRLLEVYPDAVFAATYYDAANGRRRFSLRSEDDQFDVAEIAQAQGGGGHRNAAGFETAIP